MGSKKITPGTAVVVLNELRDMVLLHLRNDKPNWSLPGGPPEFGESIAQCAIRETKEETGVDIELLRLVGIYSTPGYWIFDYPDGNEVHAFAAAFESRVISGSLRPNMIDSLDVKWFPTDQLPRNIMPMHPKVIVDCLTSVDGVID